MTWIEIRKRFEKFQKLLARWADAETPAIAETAATMVRKLMAARAIDPLERSRRKRVRGRPQSRPQRAVSDAAAGASPCPCVDRAAGAAVL
jgi:hypothetical protein